MPASTSIEAGKSLTVSWTSSSGNPKDWIGWYRSGDSNTGYDPNRWRYTGGAASGTFTVTAPSNVGNYEFRYLLNDGYTDVARSSTVAVGQALNSISVTSPASSSSTSNSAGGGRVFYVATNGNDNNPGSETQPFLTLARALQALSSGDTLLVRGGEYDTVNGLATNGSSSIPSGGSWANPTIIKAYPGEKPVFRRFLPQDYGVAEDQVRNSIHLPTYEECAKYASYGLVSNFPYSCWQGSGNNQPAGGLFWQAPLGYIPGYVVDMYNIRFPVRYVVIDGIDIDAKGLVPNPVGFSDYSEHIRFQNLEIRYGIGSCVTQFANDPGKESDLQFIRTKIHSCGVPFDTNTINGMLARKNVYARYWHGWYMHAGGASFVDSESYNHAGTGLGPDGNNNIITGSYIHDNAAQGIYIAGGNNWTIENNIFYNNGMYEVFHYNGGQHSIRNNTIVASPKNEFAATGVGSAGIYLHLGSWGSLYENNIVDGFRYGAMNTSQGSSSVFRNNLIRSKPYPNFEIYSSNGTPTTNQNNIFNQDPLLVDPANGDFRLQAGSPAIGKATDGGNIGARR
jgi:parallel beta-helix repeat protein